MKQTVHILWGELAVSRYRNGIIDNTVRLAHRAYEFPNVQEARAFVYGISEARSQGDWAVVSKLPDIQRLGMPLQSRLLEAVKRGDLEAVERLLDMGVKPDSKGPDGLNALHIAAQHGQALIAERLIEHGANVNEPAGNNLQSTPLHLACEHASPSSPEVVDLLLEKGANKERPDARGMKPLHHAALSLSKVLVRQLLDERVDPTPENNEGLTPYEMLKKQFSQVLDSTADDIMKILREAELALARGQHNLHHIRARPKLRPYPNDRD